MKKINKKTKFILVSLGILVFVNLFFVIVFSPRINITGRAIAEARNESWIDEDFNISDMQEGDWFQLPDGRKVVLVKKGFEVEAGEVLE